MTNRKILSAIVVIAVCEGISQRASGAGCEDVAQKQLVDGRPRSVPGYLVEMDRCLGSEADDDDFARRVTVLLDGDTSRAARVDDALDALISEVGGAAKLLPAPNRDAALKSLQDAKREAKAGGGAGQGALAATGWDWQVVLRAAADLEIATQLATGCASTSTLAACTTAIGQIDAWLRLAALARRTLAVYSEEYAANLEAQLERRVKMWHAYRDDGLPQFAWEYALNSAVMRRADRRQTDPDGRNPQGFEPIPDSQLILLHPGVGLAWRDAKGTPDEDVKPAVYMELFGINRWSWDEDSGAMLGGKGISAILTYTDRTGTKNLGYGLMFHSRTTKQFTLGVARSGGRMVYMLNVDLAEYVKDKLSYWRAIEGKVSSEAAALGN